MRLNVNRVHIVLSKKKQKKKQQQTANHGVRTNSESNHGVREFWIYWTLRLLNYLELHRRTLGKF